MTVIPFPAQSNPPSEQTNIFIDRLDVGDAANWQKDIIAECRWQKALTPEVPKYLTRTGLLRRCTFLMSIDSASPLLFKHFAHSTLAILGRAWGRAMLDQPENADPHSELARHIGLQYVEAVEGGQALFNRIRVTGLGQPFIYTQALYGWLDNGRRAVLSCVDVLEPDLSRIRPGGFR